MLGSKCKQHMAYAIIDTLNKIESCKKVKEVLTHSRMIAKKAKALIRYSKAKNTKQTLWMTLQDKERLLMENWLYGRAYSSITRTLADARKIPDRSVIAKKCLPIKRSSKKGGHNTSGSCSTDLSQARCPI